MSDNVTRYLICICQKPEYLENEIKYGKIENAFLFLETIIY